MFKVEIIRGDITQIAAEALVNPANNHLWMGGGVAGALKRAGGWEIEMAAENQGPIEVGQTVVTTAGRLAAKYIIHAVVMAQNLVTTPEYIREATKNSLERARALQVKTLVLPAFGTGVGRLPVEEAAQIMLQEVKKFARTPSSLETVTFVLYREKEFHVFQEEWERQST
ncbi:MAG: macro domain-containing protein [Dehalococcoidales bacterium]|nr:macro domain-containing protein [Dehalococcoidales bacterium]